MKKIFVKLALLVAVAPLVSCTVKQIKTADKKSASNDRIWHYSTIDAMRRGIYEGTHTVKELKDHGDFGLGTFNYLNGEMIALDGIIYRIPPSGKVESILTLNYHTYMLSC